MGAETSENINSWLDQFVTVLEVARATKMPEPRFYSGCLLPIHCALLNPPYGCWGRLPLAVGRLSL